MSGLDAQSVLRASSLEDRVPSQTYCGVRSAYGTTKNMGCQVEVSLDRVFTHEDQSDVSIVPAFPVFGNGFQAINLKVLNVLRILMSKCLAVRSLLTLR